MEISLNSYRWLTNSLKIIKPDPTLQPNGKCTIPQEIAKQFENGIKIGQILVEIFKSREMPPPSSLTHLKKSTHTAAQLYNWNVLNELMRKIDFEVDPDTKNLIINGDRDALVAVIDTLRTLHVNNDSGLKIVKNTKQIIPNILEESNKPAATQPIKKQSKVNKSDLLQYVLDVLSSSLKLTRKQAVALLAQNNKYLAHVFVKGVKGSFVEVDEVMQRFYDDSDMIIQKIVENNDLCVFYLQLIKPALLSKNQEIALWASRILTKVGYDLSNNELLPIAYEWFIKENGGLATTMLALNRHPKLNEASVGYILQFARFNVSQLFTVELRKFCTDNLSYLRFIYLIFDALVESKLSAEEILNSGALDYWIEQAEKGADSDYRNSVEMRMTSLSLLVKIWKAYSIHIEETLNIVNNIMNYVKKGIRDQSPILKFHFLQQLFSLLIHFATQKNPFASVLYKKITFLFIENHEIADFREYVLRNFKDVFRKFPSIPVEIFLQPFVKQLKISQGKTYIINIFDMEFVQASAQHRKLKVKIGIELFDLLAKIFLNDMVFNRMARTIMEYMVDRFIEDEPFLEYCLKLVKICLAIFYSSLKKRPKGRAVDEETRLAMQRRADIVQFIAYLIKKEEVTLNEQLRILLVHIRLQILNNFKFDHKGILELLKIFGDPDDIQKDVMKNNELQRIESYSESSRQQVKLPRIASRNSAREEVLSQGSFQSQISGVSKNTTKQQFPVRDYQQFETDEQKRFMKQHGLGLKKKDQDGKIKPKASLSQQKKKQSESREKNLNITSANNKKVMEQIDKIREKKEEEIRKKFEEQRRIDEKKEQLKQKIKRQLQQRNLAKGNFQQKNLEVKVIFQDNQINEKVVAADSIKQAILAQQENRDEQSVALTLKKYDKFLRKVFQRYSNVSKAKGRQTFDENSGGLMSQVDYLRMFKQKNIQKNKAVLQEIFKIACKQRATDIDYEAFIRCLEQFAIYTYHRDKIPSKVSLGAYLKETIKKISVGQNFKLEDEDQQSRALNKKFQDNPQMEIPSNFKKAVQTVSDVSFKLTHQNKKAVPEKYVISLEILNEIINKKLGFNIIEPHIFLLEQAKIVKKGQAMPPKPVKKEQQDEVVQKKTIEKPRETSVAKPMKRTQSEGREGQSLERKLNQVEKHRLEEEQQKRKKLEAEELMRKQRAAEIKRRLEEQQRLKEQEVQSKKDQQKQAKNKEQQKMNKQKQAKQQYLKDQKQKLQKHKKEQEKKEMQEKQKKEEESKKAEEARRQQLKTRQKKQQEKRREEVEQIKKKRLLDEEQEKNRKIEQEKKKQMLKKKAQKVLDEDKEKREVEKSEKEFFQKLYKQPEIYKVFSQFRDQLKALHSFGMEFNDYKLDQAKKSELIEQKGWLFITQSFNICDVSTAQSVLKSALREKEEKGISLLSLEQTLLDVSCHQLLKSQYESAKKQASQNLRRFLNNLGIPKEKYRQKQLFVKLKSGQKITKESGKKLENVDVGQLEQLSEMEVVNPQGKKEKWNMKE